MTLVIPPGYAQAVYRLSLTGDPEEALTTIGVDMDTYPDGQTAANSLHTDFASAYPAANILAGWTFLGVRLYVGQDGTPPVIFESTGGVIVGVNAGPSLPPNCAFLVQKRSALGGRQGRGRMYLPAGMGVGEDSVPITGVMAEAQRAALNTRVNTWLDIGTKVILHDDQSPGALVPTPITAFTMVARLATQRRRLRP